MSVIKVQKSDVINAHPAGVYAVLADYVDGHPAILPKPYFTDLFVEQGGQGAGTVVRIQMNVFGNKQTYRQEISEPEPGRILVETDLERDLKTTFTVEPLDDGNRSHVTITTEFSSSPGVAGFMEKVFNPLVMRHIYKKELRQLDAYMKKAASST